MDNGMIMRHLSLSRRHLEQGRDHLARQEKIIARLDALGLDSSRARGLLALFEDTQKLHLINCIRLENELNAAEKARPQRERNAAEAELQKLKQAGSKSQAALSAGACQCRATRSTEQTKRRRHSQ